MAALRGSTGSPHARILGVGAYRPSRVIPNSEVIEAIDSSDEWIQQRSGIKQRRWATPEETIQLMSVAASRQAMERVVSNAGEVSALIEQIATGTREQSQGVEEVGRAAQELDQTTQCNAALVEQTAAAAAALKEQAQTLSGRVARFKLPEGGQDVAVVEREPQVTDFDFDTAIEAHRHWKVKLRSAIEKREQLDAATICRDDQCPLGRWLHGPGGARWSSKPGFSTLLQAHAGFHQAAGQVAQTINRGAYDQANHLLGSGSKFAQASNETVTAILRAKRGF